jgi:hypothetical protein
VRPELGSPLQSDDGSLLEPVDVEEGILVRMNAGWEPSSLAARRLAANAAEAEQQRRDESST